MQQRELTEDEWALISLIRNARRAYPNGRWLVSSILDMVDELLSHDYESSEEEPKE